MGLTSFILLAARSSWSQLEEDADYFFNQEPISEPFHLNAMPCSHTGKLSLVFDINFRTFSRW
jgi:hypothetical protein